MTGTGRVLVTGAGGLLGSEVARAAGERGAEVAALTRADLDVTDHGAVERTVSAFAPDLVVQCAAYTNVDGAEQERKSAMAVNRDATRTLGETTRRQGGRLVYVSTDYVFDGDKATPYVPDDRTNPLSHYGRTKLAGERAALGTAADALVVRTSWIFGGARANFVTAVVDRAARGETLRVVSDQTGGPSWSRDVAEALLDLAADGAVGVWHVASGGGCLRSELAAEAIRLAGHTPDIVDVTSEEWGAPAPRPLYSVLDVTATEARLGRRMPGWRSSLAAFLTEHVNE